MHLNNYKPTKYLHESTRPGSQYSFTNMDNVLKQAAKRAGVTREGHLHMLRDPFTTRPLEEGYDVSYLQRLLGYYSFKTTRRYKHLPNKTILSIRTPFDKLKLKSQNPHPPTQKSHYWLELFLDKIICSGESIIT